LAKRNKQPLINLSPEGYRIFCIIFGLVFMAVGLYVGQIGYDYKSNGIKAQALVISSEFSGTAKNRRAKYELEFIDTSGNKIRTIHKMQGSSAPDVHKGDKLDIYYMASAPYDKIHVPTIGKDIIFPLIFISIGMLTALFSRKMAGLVRR
jgi:hypothetical protein